jgi:hypothetical protein
MFIVYPFHVSESVRFFRANQLQRAYPVTVDTVPMIITFSVAEESFRLLRSSHCGEKMGSIDPGAPKIVLSHPFAVRLRMDRVRGDLIPMSQARDMGHPRDWLGVGRFSKMSSFCWSKHSGRFSRLFFYRFKCQGHRAECTIASPGKSLFTGARRIPPKYQRITSERELNRCVV